MTDIKPDEKLLGREPKLPTIKIAEQLWPVPKFAPKQNEVIVPIVLELSQKMVEAMSSPKEMRLQNLSQVLTGENYHRINTCVFLALERGHPELTRKYYDEEMEVGTMEMVEAFTVIAERTGLIKIVAKPKGDAVPLGEAEAGNSQTGP